MKLSVLKHILFGFVLLFIFHFETIDIVGIKISHLWKGLALLYILLNLVKNEIKLFLYRPYIIIAIMQLIHIDLSNNSSTPIFNFIITLFLPLIGVYVLKYNIKQLKYALFYFSFFFIASFIPYKLGIIQSIKQGYSLQDFGSVSYGLIGPFQTAHSASLTLATALVVIVFFLFEGSVKIKYLLPLFLIGFYFLMITYVRTGLVMFIVGILPIFYYYAKKSAKYRFRIIIMGSLMSFLVSTWVLSSPTMMNRIQGERTHNSEDSFRTLGSGRGLIWLSSTLVFLESSTKEKLVGMGEIEQKKRIGQKTGMNIASHNGFLDLLLVNGIIGLIIFLIFLYRILKFLFADKSSYSSLALGLFVLYLTMCFFQGYSWINTTLMLMLSLSLCYNSSLHKNNMNKLTSSNI